MSTPACTADAPHTTPTSTAVRAAADARIDVQTDSAGDIRAVSQLQMDDNIQRNLQRHRATNAPVCPWRYAIAYREAYSQAFSHARIADYAWPESPETQ